LSLLLKYRSSGQTEHPTVKWLNQFKLIGV
jgi:hypothetical protein